MEHVLQKFLLYSTFGILIRQASIFCVLFCFMYPAGVTHNLHKPLNNSAPGHVLLISSQSVELMLVSFSVLAFTDSKYYT